MHKRLSLVAALLIVAATLAGAAAAVLASEPGPAYLQVSSFEAASQNRNTTKLTITTLGPIPRQPDAFINSNPVVGLAWADLTTGKVFVTTIHPVLGRDSHQNPNGWHAHTATLAGGAAAPNDFCVVSIDSAPTAGIQVQGDTMNVNVRTDSLPVAPSAFNAAVGFTIQPDSSCTSGLAVRIVS